MKQLQLHALKALLATALFTVAGMASAVPVTTTCEAAGTGLDLQTAGTQETLNGALFTSIDTNGSVGTGVFPAFVKEQGDGCIQGYNTDGTREFDTLNSPLFAILLSTMDVVTIGTTDYVEFHLDINQQHSNDGLSLDNVRIFADSSNTLTGYDDATCTLGGISCIYDMDGAGNYSLELRYVLNNGSGNGYDLQFLLPTSVFGSNVDASNTYVYLFSQFGGLGGAFTENDGPEEWAYRRCPEGQTCWAPPQEQCPPTAPECTPTVPEPGTLALIGISLLSGVAVSRKRLLGRIV
jgi:hypothetical protein